tara:strand:+ start:49 stop:987 length:939 start_codon:yes stop_codon:yes gene_type:complete
MMAFPPRLVRFARVHRPLLSSWRAFATRDAAVPPPRAATTKLSLGHGLTLRTPTAAAAAAAAPEEGRPIAIVAGWLGARERQLRRFSDFYSERGYDVVTFAAGPFDVLMPSRGDRLMRHVMETVDKMSAAQADIPPRPVVFHGFSVSGYLYGLALLAIDAEPMKFGRFASSVKVQAFDSPPDFENIALGVGRSMGFQGILSLWVTRALDLYLLLTRYGAGKQYRASSKALHDNELRAASIFFFSKSDPVADHVVCERVAGLWRGRGNRVEEVVWEESPHIQHAKRDGARYFHELELFLDENLKPSEGEDKET